MGAAASTEAHFERGASAARPASKQHARERSARSSLSMRANAQCGGRVIEKGNAIQPP